MNLLHTVLVLEIKPKFRHRFTGLTFRVKCFTMNKDNFTHAFKFMNEDDSFCVSDYLGLPIYIYVYDEMCGGTSLSPLWRERRRLLEPWIHLK